MTEFRTIRRTDRDLGREAAMRILSEGYCGTLCVMGSIGYPYGVPMNYVSDNESILFHCSSRDGHLLESIGDRCRACFTVFERLEGARSRSAIAFGTVRADPTMLARTLNGIVDKYIPESGREAARIGIPHAEGGATALVFRIENVNAKVVDKPKGR